MLNPIEAIKKISSRYSRKFHGLSNQQAILHREYARIKQEIGSSTPGNPALFGYKVYSQFDEDGIIAHIFSKIGKGDRAFLEIGCSDGLENNTHALLLEGWRGVWIDADVKKAAFLAKHLPATPRLIIKRAFVSVSNGQDIVSDALTQLGIKRIDFLSIDIDGDDLNVLLAILKCITPRVICAEYNAKFPPPMRVSVQGRSGEFWSGDDYHGASLSAIEEALHDEGYRLVSCGASGVNAFFVRTDEAGAFPQFTVEQLFRPAMFELSRIASGHPASLKFLADHLAGPQSLDATK